MSRQQIFAQKEYSLSTEVINFYAGNMTQFKLNTHRVLTDLDILTAGNGISILNGVVSCTGEGGVTTLAPIGSAPNENGGTIAGITYTQQPASATFGGVVTALAQSFKGDKTFVDNIFAQKDINLNATTNSGAVGVITIGGTRLHDFSDYVSVKNLFMGYGAGNFINTGSLNTCFGTQAGESLTSGASNVILSHGTSSLTTGTNNTLINGQFGNLTTGLNNTLVGYQAGQSYTSSETNNICINNPGTVGENGSIRIGNNGAQSSLFFPTFIATTINAAATNFNVVEVNPANGKIGSRKIFTELVFIPIRGQTVTTSPVTLGLTGQTAPNPLDLILSVNSTTNLISIGSPGSYVFKVVTHSNIGAVFYMQFVIDGVQSDGGTMAVLPLANVLTSASWTFYRNIPKGSPASTIEFRITGNSCPVAGTTPVVSGNGPPPGTPPPFLGGIIVQFTGV